MPFDYDLCVVHGCGRVGLPLALCVAEAGLKVCIDDSPVMTGEEHLVDLELLYHDCQVLILGNPHRIQSAEIPPHIELVDVWNFMPEENVSESIR